MKKIVSILFVICSGIVQAASPNMLNQRNIQGQTPLHCLFDKISEISDPSVDQRAAIAACFIMHGARVGIKDVHGRTPLEQAWYHKDKLPKLYEVMCAGAIIQKYEQRLNAGIDISKPSKMEVFYEIKPFANQDPERAYKQAFKILESYYSIKNESPTADNSNPYSEHRVKPVTKSMTGLDEMD